MLDEQEKKAKAHRKIHEHDGANDLAPSWAVAQVKTSDSLDNGHHGNRQV